jgi:hypothetical protein
LGKWDALKFDLGPIPQLAEAIQTLADTIVTVATIVKAATEIIATLVTDLLNVEAMLIKAALQAIEDILNQFIQGTVALHLLAVPPRRFLPVINDSATDWTLYDNPYTAISPPLMEDSRDFYQKLDAVFNILGGNPAFGRTVLESLGDQADFNRPQYGATDAYYSVVILAGATSILELIGYIQALMSVFKGKTRTMLPPVIAPPPQDLKASTVSASTSNRVAVRVSWKNPPTQQELRAFDDAKPFITEIREVAIVRTTDPTMITAKLWNDILLNYQPTALSDSEREHQNVKSFTTAKGKVDLIRIFKFDGVRESYVDDDAALTKGVTYHYAAAYRYAFVMPDLDGKVTPESYLLQNYFAISNVAKALVDKEKYVTHRAGLPPDWDMTPNVLDLIPDLKFFLALIKNYVEAMKSQVTGAQSAINSYIAFLESEIKRYSDYALAVAEKIRSLSELAKILQGGLYVTVIEGAAGGTQAFIGELMNRLMDESDDTAPPFFRHGVTAGLVIYAGAPNPLALESVKALIALLLGFGSGGSVLEQAIDSVDKVMGVLEIQPNFTPAMLPTTTTATPPTDETTFDDAMAPVPAGTSGSNIPFDP